jgi:excisionase family DNA binding protein
VQSVHDKTLLSPKRVAQAIGVSEASLKRWCDKGILTAIRTAGGHRRIPVENVIQFLRDTRQRIVRPELLSLPANTKSTELKLCDVIEIALESIRRGDEEQFSVLVINQFLANQSIVDICDQLIAPVFHRVGDLWNCGEMEVFQERRGCEICIRLLRKLISFLPALSDSAPLAIGGTFEGDQYAIPTTMIEAVLRESGWSASSLGSNLPISTICAAVQQIQPRLVWLSCSYIQDSDRFIHEYAQLYDVAHENGSAVVVGGRVLAEDIRREIRFSSHGDNLQHLVSYVTSLH